MKYKIIPDDIVKNIIEFLDEIQFEAASGNKPDDIHRINFINWLIGELMNGLDGFDLEDENNKDKPSPEDIENRWDTIDKYRKDYYHLYQRIVTSPIERSPDRWDNRIAFYLKEAAQLNYLGSAGISAIPDFAKIIIICSLFYLKNHPL